MAKSCENATIRAHPSRDRVHPPAAHSRPSLRRSSLRTRIPSHSLSTLDPPWSGTASGARRRGKMRARMPAPVISVAFLFCVFQVCVSSLLRLDSRCQPKHVCNRTRVGKPVCVRATRIETVWLAVNQASSGTHDASSTAILSGGVHGCALNAVSFPCQEAGYVCKTVVYVRLGILILHASCASVHAGRTEIALC